MNPKDLEYLKVAWSTRRENEQEIKWDRELHLVLRKSEENQ